jgi:LEA14-like dessication related protein
MLGIQNFKIGEIKEGKINVTITVKVNNPNKYKIKVKKTALDLFIEDKNIGQAIMKEDLIIEKSTEKNYDFTVQADYKVLSKSALGIVTKALFQKTINVQVKGNAKAVVRGIFSKNFDIDLKKDIPIKDLMSKFM